MAPSPRGRLRLPLRFRATAAASARAGTRPSGSPSRSAVTCPVQLIHGSQGYPGQRRYLSARLAALRIASPAHPLRRPPRPHGAARGGGPRPGALHPPQSRRVGERSPAPGALHEAKNFPPVGNLLPCPDPAFAPSSQGADFPWGHESAHGWYALWIVLGSKGRMWARTRAGATMRQGGGGRWVSGWRCWRP